MIRVLGTGGGWLKRLRCVLLKGGHDLYLVQEVGQVLIFHCRRCKTDYADYGHD